MTKEKIKKTSKKPVGKEFNKYKHTVGFLGVSVVLLVGSLVYSNINYKDQEKNKQEKYESELLSLQNDNQVLNSQFNNLEDSFISLTNMREKLNKESSSMPILFKGDSYYFGIDEIHKQSLDVREEYRYDLLVTAHLLKDRISGDDSYINNVIPTNLYKLEFEGEGETEEDHDSHDQSEEHDDLTDKADVIALERKLKKEVEVFSDDIELSFVYDINNLSPLLSEKEVIKLFVEGVILKDQKVDSIDVKDGDSVLDITVKVNGSINNYSLDKNSREFSDI
jgi:hypothetical protein